ncbi:MAG: tetratricopeptide repeat protein [Roseburia sp.]|nr:tetratricopeptide repeat protein [Roseburia sp.]MCM1202079.1 tetratricopeptide repeat protein [Bacteroides fragilis]
MAEQIIKDYQLISINQLIRAMKEGRDNAERFCFIIGSGASVSSGIPTGAVLESQWMKEMEEASGLEEIREVAKGLKEYLDNDFADIEADWEGIKKSGELLPSKYYFDIYKLRFFPNHRNGYHYLEKIMANKNPGFGYHPLALMLTDGSGSNLVITTNFDSLIEDALFLYTDDKPLVINHELLAEYAGDSNIKRPIIAKVHRGIFFDPLNQPEETNELKGKWKDVLASVFQNYTPVVIGYGGGDNSLMNLLEDDNIRMKNGIYWCYFEKYGLPDNKIQTLVKKKNGYLVRTAGFDAAMLSIGNAFFPDKIGVHEAEKYLNNRTNMRIANYEEEYKRLTEQENLEDKGAAAGPVNQSENDFKIEIGKMVERTVVSEKKREESNQMTAWDYKRQGDRHCGLKEYEKAVESYSRAIDMQPNIAQFYKGRGYAYRNLGKYDEAVSDYNKAIELSPGYANAYNNRGFVYKSLKEYDRALSDYNRAIELEPELANPYNNRGFVYHDLGEYDKALSDYNKAIELDPEYVMAYNNRGFVYHDLGEYDKALSDYNKAIELDPGYAMAYNNRGFTYDSLGEYDKAAADYDKAIKLDPEYASPCKHQGVLWKKKNNLEKAVSFLTKAIELDPKYKEAYAERAEVYRLMGEESRAAADEATAEKL